MPRPEASTVMVPGSGAGVDDTTFPYKVKVTPGVVASVLPAQLTI